MKKKYYLFLLTIPLFLAGCDKPTRTEKIEKIISKEYKSVHLDEYSKADTKMIVNGSGNMVSLRDDLKNAISIDFKVPFSEVKITPSNENYFRIIGDSNLVNNIAYKNENKMIKFDFKAMIGAQENPLKLEIYTNQIEYIDNNSVNFLTLEGKNNNMNIQNKGFLTVKLINAQYKDLLINNLGKLSIEGTGVSENLYITDLNMSDYALQGFKTTNLSIKTRGMSKGVLNVSHLTIGEVGLLSSFIITGNPKIKKATTGIKGKLEYN